MKEPQLTEHEALQALNTLRSNIVATQNASWSNTLYPLVAILNDAGLEVYEPSETEQRHHLNCYGGAGGYPGNELRAPREDWYEPIDRLKVLRLRVHEYLADPSDKNRRVLARVAAYPPDQDRSVDTVRTVT